MNTIKKSIFLILINIHHTVFTMNVDPNIQTKSSLEKAEKINLSLKVNLIRLEQIGEFLNDASELAKEHKMLFQNYHMLFQNYHELFQNYQNLQNYCNTLIQINEQLVVDSEQQKKLSIQNRTNLISSFVAQQDKQFQHFLGMLQTKIAPYQSSINFLNQINHHCQAIKCMNELIQIIPPVIPPATVPSDNDNNTQASDNIDQYINL